MQNYYKTKTGAQYEYTSIYSYSYITKYLNIGRLYVNVVGLIYLRVAGRLLARNLIYRLTRRPGVEIGCDDAVVLALATGQVALFCVIFY